MAKLKIAGLWSGVLEVELENWTVPMLREEVAKRSNCRPEVISLICGGKLLKDGNGDEKLSELSVKSNTKILASRVCFEEGKLLKEELMAEEERSSRLTRVKAAATAMVNRHASGSLPVEDFNLELEDQSGQKVEFGSETDRRAMMMGLMLHANAKHLLRRQKYKDALEVLTMGEEAFSLCDPKAIELIDNVPILQIDIVWCYFMLRDISWLAVAGKHLQKARQGIERAHGKDSFRVRLLQAGRHPEIALHLRLELLEGVAAYHSAQFETSRKALMSAQDKFFQLQVPDEALSLVIGMGFKERDAKRALRMTNQDVGSAIEFLIEEREKKAKKRDDNIQRQKEIMEQKRYGMTPLKKAVDLQRLNELVSIGFEKDLAAEALRRNENDSQKALDELTNVDTNSAIQLDIESRKRKRQREAADAAVGTLVSMGFDRTRASAAIGAGLTVEQAMHQLLAQFESDPTFAANGVDSATNGADSSVPIPNNLPSGSKTNDDVGGTSTASEIETRDLETENELTQELSRESDIFSDYDIDVTIEGEAINEYLALLASTGNGEIASSSQ